MEINILFLFVAILAGALTVFAPCIFTFLPVILRGVENGSDIKRSLRVILSLAVSVFVFTLLLKSSTLLLSIPISVWEVIAGLIIILQGLVILLPKYWGEISEVLGFSSTVSWISKIDMVKNQKIRDILIGVALGPVFSSCSPTYGYIVGIILPSSISSGIVYLLSYILGLVLILTIVSVYGNSILRKYVDPNGKFKKIIGWTIFIIGILIFLGVYKDVESYIINYLPFLNITKLDYFFLQGVM